MLVKNKNADAHQREEVKRCKSKTNFSLKSKKLTVKNNNKRSNLNKGKINKNRNNKSSLILNFWEGSDKKNKSYNNKVLTQF